jgi:single-strand DNA-binding protein
MARGVNKVILLGNLGKDPELSYLPSGQSVAKFSLATSRKFKDKNGELKDETEWHNIVAWGKLGEIAAQYLKKGRQAYIEGRISSRKWEDREGKPRTTYEIVADEVVMVGGRGEEGGEPPARSMGSARPSRPASSAPDDFGEPASQEITDDDIPF